MGRDWRLIEGGKLVAEQSNPWPVQCLAKAGVGVHETRLLTKALRPALGAASVWQCEQDLMLANLTPLWMGRVPPYHLWHRSPFHQEDF